MNKMKVAKGISTFTNPPIICIPLFFIICLVLSFTDVGFDLNKFIVLEVISLIFASLLPMAIILSWARKLGTDKDISNRSDRYTPLVVGIISYFIGFLICMILNLDYFFRCLLLCYAINTGIVLIITTKWKISVHTTGLSGPVGALILLLGPAGAFLGILYPILIWSRVLLKKHTMAQAISGAVQGFFLTVIEMYIFIYVFSLPITNIIGLYDACLYISAIIITPILLGLLSYVKVKSPQLTFIAAEVILWVMFLIIMPVDIFIIFAAVSITAVLISFYAGDDFIWYKIISGQSFSTL